MFYISGTDVFLVDFNGICHLDSTDDYPKRVARTMVDELRTFEEYMFEEAGIYLLDTDRQLIQHLIRPLDSIQREYAGFIHD